MNSEAQIKKRIAAMSWPQFIEMVMKLRMDPDEFPERSAPTEINFLFARQLEVYGLSWNDVESALPGAKQPAAREPVAAPRIAAEPEKGTPPKAAEPATAVKPVRTSANKTKAPAARSFDDAIRILHISDLHFTAGTDVKTTLRHLTSDLKDYDKLSGDGKLHYLVASGDFTNKGGLEGFPLAAEFIKLLQESLKLTDGRKTLLVPGNHDVVDQLNAYKRVPSKTLTEADKKRGLWVEEGKLLMERDGEHYLERFKPFSEFYKAVTGTAYPLQPEAQHRCASFWDDRIQFLCFNSAWEIDEFNRKRASVHHTAASELSEIARNEEQSSGLPSDERILRIGVCHHAITGPEQIKNTAFVDNLQRRRLRIMLHGDVHTMTRAEYLGHSPGNRVHVIGAGAFAADAMDRPESTPCVYNILELQRDFKLLRVHTRMQETRDRDWEGYARWERPDGGDGALSYYDIALA